MARSYTITNGVVIFSKSQQVWSFEEYMARQVQQAAAAPSVETTKSPKAPEAASSH